MLNRLRSLWHVVQYVYYLRFALLLWLGVPALALLDPAGNPAPLIHAIFTPEYPGQFLADVFFAMNCSMVALLFARIVCINGCDRFPSPGAGAPTWLTRWLGYGTPDSTHPGTFLYSDRRALIVFLAAQTPNAYVVYRLFQNSHHGDVNFCEQLPSFIGGATAGLLLALAFWWLVSVVYYWTFPYNAFRRPARTLLYPRWCFGLPADASDPDTIERCGRLRGLLGSTLSALYSILPRLSPSGYSSTEPIPAAAVHFAARHVLRSQLWEAHRLAVLGLLGSMAIYVFLLPLTAPTPHPWGNRIVLVLAAGTLALLCQSFYSVRLSKTSPKSARWRCGLITFFLGVVLVLCTWFVASWVPHSAEAKPGLSEFWFRPPVLFFPVMGSVTVLLIFSGFVLAGAAFFFDRFSFPVLTSVILLVTLLHKAFPDGEDHYYPARKESRALPLLTPQDILKQRCPVETSDCSIIVLTASGGGMHAAVWSSSIFVELEKEMTSSRLHLRPEVHGFHQNLMFASTVSGGSIGFAPILREYLAQSPAGSFDLTAPPFSKENSEASLEPLFAQRIGRAVGCSSLEAVAWGLTYSDFLHLLFPFLPDTREFDRSASLQVASERNYVNPKCGPVLPKPAPGHETKLFDPSDLDHLSLGAADLQPSSTMPAFTFNTTEVETGGRFLLANYGNRPAVDSLPPSESFLHVYPKTNIGLVTAARLSAAYPYVSSAARIDRDIVRCPAAHFVDGGYYDNDGVASLVEFLSAAFSPGAKPRQKRIRILLIEIRDGWDVDAQSSPEASYPDGAPNSWHTAEQIAAPLNTFWRTGHGSISRRDRRELLILKRALEPQAELTEAVFPFNGNTPLSWHLSSGDIATIRGTIANPAFRKRYLEPALDWAVLKPADTNDDRSKKQELQSKAAD